MIPTNLKRKLSGKDIFQALGNLVNPSSSRSDLIDKEYAFASAKSNPEISEPWIFVGIQGTKVDGHDFIEDAIKNGASLIIALREVKASVPVIVVKDSRAALSKLVAKFYGNPSEELQIIGITGTNGKTTTNWLIHHTLNLIAARSIRIGTLGFALPGGESEILGETGLTTPDAETLQGVLRWGITNGAKCAVLEVSSHALSQHRAADLEFDVAVFTNLTRDHLDFHETEENYKEAKWRLFELLSRSKKRNRIGVINTDDATGREFYTRALQLSGIELITFGRGKDASLRILSESQSFDGSRIQYSFKGEIFAVEGPFIGAHNAENIAATLGVLLGLGYRLSDVLHALKNLPAVPGRLEPVNLSPKFGVFVDYAHTPDALMRVLHALRPLTPGRLLVLFGCGGNRDKGKRPLMRKIATELSDRVIVTSDNPRLESPLDIISDVMAGASGWELAKTTTEVDRRKGIKKAIEELQSGDVLLVAGKGHEDYQIVGDVKHPFLDAAVLKEEFHHLQR
jgi:UDP-N-acetylmuramoyl-L-alanyl-D-glutamate--2,6-diaminopimelate ligase